MHDGWHVLRRQTDDVGFGTISEGHTVHFTAHASNRACIQAITCKCGAAPMAAARATCRATFASAGALRRTLDLGAHRHCVRCWCAMGGLHRRTSDVLVVQLRRGGDFTPRPSSTSPCTLRVVPVAIHGFPPDLLPANAGGACERLHLEWRSALGGVESSRVLFSLLGPLGARSSLHHTRRDLTRTPDSVGCGVISSEKA